MNTIKNLTKSYYSISEVAAMFDVKSSLIRYYEAEFTFFKPHKRNGERRFTPKNIEDFGMIHNLVKESKRKSNIAKWLNKKAVVMLHYDRFLIWIFKQVTSSNLQLHSSPHFVS